MNLSSLFIGRPIATGLLMTAILLVGVAGYRELPVSDLPNVDFPTINVRAGLPGASPETMASAVAMPLEKEFSTIAGIDSMSSTSTVGSTSIALQFSLERDIDAAAQDVQAAIAAIQRHLPADMPAPPSYSKLNPANDPILFIALTSPTLPLSELNEYAENMLAQRISMVSGVSQVEIHGVQRYAVRIQLDPKALAAHGIGMDEVSAAIDSANVNLPTGTLSGPQQVVTVQANGVLLNAEAHKRIIVAHRNGRPVTLGELGRVFDDVENNKNAAWFVSPGLGINQRALILGIQRQPGANTVAVSDAVKALVPGLNEKLPGSVSLHILFDRAQSIRESVHDVTVTLLVTLGLVILVIFVFLRNVSATIIPSLALPFSIVGTFAVMYLLNFSINNLSLMALTLAVGFVVDDAIVVLENIVRHREDGEGRMDAALNGSREIGFTVVSMTVSLVAVFIPVLFMGGVLGRLFKEFAITIGVSILISGVVSLTLTPMLCSRMLKASKEAHHGWVYAAFDRFFDGMLHRYQTTLSWMLRHHRLAMLVSAVILVLTVLAFVYIPKGFVPSEDRCQVMVSTDAAQGTSFPAMTALQTQAAEAIRGDENIEAFMSSVRVGGGNMFIRLKDRDKRPLTADEVIAKVLRPKLAQIPGLRAFPRNPETIRLGARMGRAQYQYTLLGSDIQELNQAGDALEKRLRKVDLIADVSSDLQISNPELDIEIDRAKAATLGLTVQQIQRALYDAYGSRQVATIFGANNTYPVIMEMLPEYQADSSALSLLHVRSSRGTLVPLRTVANGSGVGPTSVNHTGQLPSVTLSFNLKPGVPLGQAMEAVGTTAREVLPASITTSFQGSAQVFQSSLKGLGFLLLAAIVVIYIVLGMLYESLAHPLTILSGIPAAGLGALVTLAIFGNELNIYAFVGVILLIGLVKKNGIMMVDFAVVARREQGLEPVEAIHKACSIRFRPIMMTTMAALMAGIPIAVGWGAGGEARRPLGLAIVGGLFFSQFLTLYLTPVFYLYMEKIRLWFGAKV